MSKLIKKIALAITVTLIMTFTTGIAFADEIAGIQTEPESEATTEPSVDEPETGEPEKELILYNRDGDIDGDGEEDLWTGFTYKATWGDTLLEIYYNGKTLSSLIDEGYEIEYRNYDIYTSYPAGWGSITNLINGDVVYLPPSNIFQLKILKADGSLVSMSDRFLMDMPSEFPVIISSNPYHYKLIDYDGKSTKVTLKYNDNLVLKDENKDASISMSLLYNLSDAIMHTPYFVSNLKYNNHSETVTIDGKDYIWNYCIVTFNCNFSHFEPTISNSDSSSVSYRFDLQNLVGTRYNAEPYYFIYAINSYKDTSLNPQKKLIIKKHENQMNINKDENLKLYVNIFSKDVCFDTLVWESSDESVAKVNQFGIVTAIGTGTAYIYATEDKTDELYDYCIVNVVDEIPVNTVSLDYTTLDLKMGESHKLKATVTPEDASDKSVKWSSSDESVATVDENGLVSAKKAGTVSITATSNYDSSITATCTVSVTESKVESIKISGVPDDIKAGGSFKLQAVISPANATDKEVAWKSSNTKYATVSSDGVVKIKSAGAGKSVKITATAKDGSGVKKTITIKIQKVKVTKITLKASKSTVTAGKTVKVKAVISPTNATDKEVTWKSSNTKYATVTSGGVVKTKKAGKGKKVTITAVSKDNSKVKGSITIKIK